MSTVTSAVTTCPDLQVGLEEVFLTCSDLSIFPDANAVTLTPFLYSPTNRSGVNYTVNPVPGKKRTLQVVYEQLIDDSEATTVSDCATTCTATTERGDLSQDYEMDCDGFQMEGKFDRTDWVNSCKDNYGVIMRQILRFIAALDNRINKAMVTEVGALIGSWAEEVTTTGEVLVVPTMSTTDPQTAAPLAATWATIDLALMQTGYCAPAFFVGGADLYQYNRLMAAGCCASSGLNLAEMFALYGKAVAWDKHIQQTIGKEQTFVLMNGAIQLLTMNMNGGTETELPYINVVNGQSNYFEGIVNSPWTGLPYDINVKYDCGVVHVVVTARVKAIGMPIDLFPANYRLDGVTFANQIEVSNA